MRPRYEPNLSRACRSGKCQNVLQMGFEWAQEVNDGPMDSVVES
jgi:hypothetical protein